MSQKQLKWLSCYNLECENFENEKKSEILKVRILLYRKNYFPDFQK